MVSLGGAVFAAEARLYQAVQGRVPAAAATAG